MPEIVLESLFTGKLSLETLVKWINNESLEDIPEDCPLLCCSRSEFVAFFLSFLRKQTESILQTNSNSLISQQHSASESLICPRRKHNRSTSDPTEEADKFSNLSGKTDRNRSHESPNRERSSQKKSGRRVKTKLFTDNDKSRDQSSNLSTTSLKTDSDESKLSTGFERLVVSSTPMKNGIQPNEYPNLPLNSPVTPHSRNQSFFKESYERCDTPRISHRHSRSSQDKSMSLGDYIVNTQASKSLKKKKAPLKSVANEFDKKVDLDFSNSEMFPEIGARKASSLRSEKRRIKPTNIDSSTPQKSFSMNSFNSESFQQPSPIALAENVAFKVQNMQTKEQSNTYDAERNLLKQERHKLMEKFNVLSMSPKVQSSPQIKVLRRETTEIKQDFVKADVNQVSFKESIDLLVSIYNVLARNNLILSLSSEIYFLISIFLSKQSEQDLKANATANQTIDKVILKTIHNCSYFAVKSLWCLRQVLEFVLEKTSLKLLGENKIVRSYYPDLAKYLLNLYGLRCEAECNSTEDKQNIPNKFSNGMVCFNIETDNADNFPSILSFQNFKKQRDMFYEILRLQASLLHHFDLRNLSLEGPVVQQYLAGPTKKEIYRKIWYNEGQTGSAKSTFRSRVKSLLSLAVSPANHAHLARLFMAHMMSECLNVNINESKLSKLQRRLTVQSTTQVSHRLPKFTAKEMFYKEFLMYAENESFRVHLRDSLASEIWTLDSETNFNSEERNNGPNRDISKEYLQLTRKLLLLSKFLGFISALPYSQIPMDYVIKTGAGASASVREICVDTPKERVFHHSMEIRNCIQPSIDLKSILSEAKKNGRLCISLPWIVQYLSLLDYTTLRTKYYQEIFKAIFEVYAELTDESTIRKSTVLYLKMTLGWLFDLPHFPQELFYESKVLESKMAPISSSDESIDSFEVIDESIVFELCPFLRDINVLLLTSKPTADAKDAGTFRHITPVTMSLNPEDRMRNKEKEVQARLKEAFIKSLPSSTRRVLELVCERVTAAVVREIHNTLVPQARERCKSDAARACRESGTKTQSELLTSLRAIYTTALAQLRRESLAASERLIDARCGKSLSALLVTNTPRAQLALAAAAGANIRSELGHVLRTHFSSTNILCKDIEAEMKNLLSLGDTVPQNDSNKRTVNFDSLLLPQEDFVRVNVSPSVVIIDMKEQICALLANEPVTTERALHLLTLANSCCDARNAFCNPVVRRTIPPLALDVTVAYISRRPKDINASFLNHLNAIWNRVCPDRKKNVPKDLEPPERRDISPQLRNFDLEERVATPESDNGVIALDKVVIVTGELEKSISCDSPGSNNNSSLNLSSKLSVTLSSQNIEEGALLLEHFERILCPRNITLLNDAKSSTSNSKPSSEAVWCAMADLLVFLLKNDYLSEDSLTEQCLAVYRQDWPQDVLQSLSVCMKSVSSRWANSSTGKFTLFLDFLAEYCCDMECDSFDLT